MNRLFFAAAQGHFPVLSVNPMIPSIALDPNNILQLGEFTAVLQLPGLSTDYTQQKYLPLDSLCQLQKCTMYCLG